MFQYKNPSAQYVRDFIEREARSYPAPQGFRWGCAVAVIERKYLHACTARDRAAPLLAEYKGLVGKHLRSLKTGAMSQEQVEQSIQLTALDFELQMQFEIFFMYGTIVCDQIAALMTHMFGGATGIGMKSHRQVAKGLTKFCATKGLEFDPEMAAAAQYLEIHLCDFRDKQVVHDFSPRRMRSIGMGAQGGLTLTSFAFREPLEADQIVRSQDWNELHTQFERYVYLFLDLLARNREKTNYARPWLPEQT